MKRKREDISKVEFSEVSEEHLDEFGFITLGRYAALIEPIVAWAKKKKKKMFYVFKPDLPLDDAEAKKMQHSIQAALGKLGLGIVVRWSPKRKLFGVLTKQQLRGGR